MPNPTVPVPAESVNVSAFIVEAYELIRDLRDALLKSEARVRELEAMLRIRTSKGGEC